MPDVEKNTEQKVEVNADTEAQAGFDAAMGQIEKGEAASGVQKPAVNPQDGQKKEDVKPGEDAGKPADGGKAGEGEQKPEPTAAEKLEKLAKGEEAGGEAGKDKGGQQETGQGDAEFFLELAKRGHTDAQQVGASAEFRAWLDKQDDLTKELVQSGGVAGAAVTLNRYKADQKSAGAPNVDGLLEELKKIKIAVKNDEGAQVEKLVGDVISEYGEVGEAMLAMMKLMAGKMGGGKLELPADLVKADQLGTVQKELANLRFWTDVLDQHPDGKKIYGSKAFEEFWSKQSDVIKNRFKGGIGSPDEMIMILDAYKETEARKAADAEKGKQAGQQAKLSGLYKGAVKQGAAGGEKKPKNSEDDYDAGFDEKAGG